MFDATDVSYREAYTPLTDFSRGSSGGRSGYETRTDIIAG